MAIPVEIRDAIQNRESVDLSTLIPVIGHSEDWDPIAEELKVVQKLGALGVERALGILLQRTPEQTFPQMQNGTHAFVPLLLPLPDKNGFFQCAVDAGPGDAPQDIRLVVSLGKPTIVHFVAQVSTINGRLNAINVHHRANDGLAVDCVWKKRPNDPRVLLNRMEWSRPGSTWSFFWAKGIGRNSMPDGAKSRKWLVHGGFSEEQAPQYWIAGGI